MPKFKGAGIVNIRNFVKSQGPEFKQEFLTRLTPPGREIFEKALAISWIDMKDDPGDIPLAAQMLFPDDPLRLRKLGQMSARSLFAGIYKVFIQILTIPFVIKRVARFWRQNYDSGEARVENVINKSLDLRVRNIPELPEAHLDFFSGFLIGVIEMAGAKEIKISSDYSDPQNWKWHLTWK